MALETVIVSVNDDQPVPQPVNGVVVRVFDSTGTTFITQATTGAPLAGQAMLTLNGAGPAGVIYQLRFYVNGGAIQSPQYIEVFSPPALAPTAANNFVVTADMFTLPTATNPRLCRASGYVWGPDGRVRPGVDMHFIPCFRPLVVDGYGVLGERVSVRSDSAGYASVDLFRSGIYQVTIESHENVLRGVYVPDRSSINLFHLLFPIAVGITYSPATPWTVSTGGQLLVTPTVTANDFRTLTGTASADITWSVDDPSIAAVTVQTTQLAITGVSPGTTTLRATRADTSIVYISDPGISGGAIPITVV